MTRGRWAPTVGPPAAGSNFRNAASASLLCAAALLLAGCSSPPPSTAPTATAATAATGGAAATPAANPCADAAAALVTAVERAVAGYDRPTATDAPEPARTSGTSTRSPTPAATPTAAPSPTRTAASDPSSGLSDAVAAARAAINRYGCAGSTFRADLEAGLKRVTTHSAVADAVLARLAASLTGRVAPHTETRQVAPGDDLAEALAELAPGSTVVLAAGTYALRQSLVLLEGVTLRGAGRDATVVKASAAGAAILVMTANQVALRDLRVELDPAVPASGVVVGPQSSLQLTSVGITGAKASRDGLGGAAVQMSGSATDLPSPTTTLEVTDAQFDRNGWAGIAVGGGHRVSILRASFSDNGQCGVCFLGASSGSVQDSQFTRNVVGLAANGRSKPTWVSDTVTGGTVGVQLDGNAAPTIANLTVTGSSRAAVIFSGHSAGAVTSATCVSVPYGIVVADTAAPTLGDVGCTLAKGG